jgi:hypothetical protein
LNQRVASFSDRTAEAPPTARLPFRTELSAASMQPMPGARTIFPSIQTAILPDAIIGAVINREVTCRSRASDLISVRHGLVRQPFRSAEAGNLLDLELQRPPRTPRTDMIKNFDTDPMLARTPNQNRLESFCRSASGAATLAKLPPAV